MDKILANNQKTYIITADWHVRGEAPRCRLDENWLESQRKDIQFVIDTANKHKADCIFMVGDMFDTSRVSTEALNMLLGTLSASKVPFYVLPGNHDLLDHAYANIEKSSLGVVFKSFPELSSTPEWDAYPFGKDAPGDKPLRFVHRLVFPDAAARPMEDCGTTAEEIALEFKNNDIIICGDYHHSFVYQHPTTGQTVINPGCLNIQKADMKDYQPSIYVVTVDYSAPRPLIPTIKKVDLPQSKDNIVTDVYLVQAKEKDARMEAFLEGLEGKSAISLSFRDNLELKQHSLNPGVQAILTEIQQEASLATIK